MSRESAGMRMQIQAIGVSTVGMALRPSYFFPVASCKVASTA